MRSSAVLIFAILCCAAVPAQFQNPRSTFTYLLRRSTTPSPANPKLGRLSSRSSALSNPSAVTPAKNDAQLAAAVADLAFAIGQHSTDLDVAADIFSPVSIMAVLNLLLLGAEGNTYRELLGALRLGNVPMSEYHRRAAGMTRNLLAEKSLESDQLAWKGQNCRVYEYEDDEEEEVAPVTSKTKELRIANAIFIQKQLPINAKFVSLANQLYGASTQTVNFFDALSTTLLINKWVTQATNGRIREVINGQFSPDTNMVIASSLYFKATWMTEFTAYATRPRDFFPDGAARGGAPFKVDMMSLTECLPYYFDKASGIKMVGLPYNDNATTMYVLMPKDSSRAKIRGLQKQLSARQIDTMISKMTRQTTTVNFPRMQLASSTNLEKSFRRLGIKTIFNAQQSNLNGMLDLSARNKIPLFVSQINHKVNLNVDEHGTEGAAVTVTLVDRSASQAYLNGNEPFLIYVRHDPTRLPLFYGAVFDPRG